LSFSDESVHCERSSGRIRLSQEEEAVAVAQAEEPMPPTVDTMLPRKGSWAWSRLL
jgi:hypothetical protein